MKIIGGHDYYDSALAYGRDDEVVFVRDNKEVPDDECPLWNGYKHVIIKGHHWSCEHLKSKSSLNDQTISLDILPVSVYVAGKHYGGMKIQDRNTLQKTQVFWDADQFESYVNSLGRKIATPDPRRDQWQSGAINSPFANVKSFMTPRDASPKQMDWLINNRVAVAIWCDHNTHYYREKIKWHCNAAEKHWSLREYDFARSMDPYTLFQELSMFVGGVLPRNPNPMVVIKDDKIKIAKHGFDKWSFRKQKDAS